MGFAFPFAGKAIKNLFSKPSTEDFPRVNVEAKEGYRGRIVYDPDKCVNCGICIKVCSPGAISRVSESVKGGSNITYTVDLTSCTFCGTCQDFCGHKAMTLSSDYHMVSTDPDKDLIVTGTKFKPSDDVLHCDKEKCIFCGLCRKNCPEEAITVDRAEKLWKLDEDKCAQCGLCVSKCPKKCLEIVNKKVLAAKAAKAAKALKEEQIGVESHNAVKSSHNMRENISKPIPHNRSLEK